MLAAEKIRKLGFRRWYERQLIAGHLWLVSCILGMLLVAVVLDVFSLRRGGTDMVLRLALAFAGGAVAVYAWGRYRDIMLLAERLGDGATCPQCRAYGSFRVLDAGPREGADDEASARRSGWLRVRCRRCGHEWTI